jgi:CubicO group peptidase (beta-lactamase class C family)
MYNRFRLIPFLCTVAICAVAVVADPTPQSQSSTAVSGPLAPVLQAMVDRHVISGAVALVADRDKAIDLEAVGYSSLATHEPMRSDDLFWIASMTKSITATGLMMLVDEGKVNVDDAVEKYLPEFKGQMVVDEKDPSHRAHPPRHPITIKECLTHTSGLIRANDPKATRAYSLEKNVAGYASVPLIREPGTKFEYNNCGISTAGRIIEVVSGMSYAEFMQRRVFDPLGMTQTTWWPTAEQAKRLARSSRLTADKTGLEDVQLDKGLTPKGIAKLGEGVSVPPEMLADFGGGKIPDYAHHFAEPAGGLFSTAADLTTFCRMLLSGGVHQGKRLLSEKAVAQMTSVKTDGIPVNPQEGYGLGWFIKIRADEGPAVGSFGHRGARKTVMWVDPAHQLVMVLLVESFDLPGNAQKELYTSFFTAAVDTYGAASKSPSARPQ